MTQQLLACPYCNAQMPRPPETVAGARVLCPRCGETFDERHGKLTVVAGQVDAAEAPPSQSSPLLKGTGQLFVTSVLLLLISAALKLALPEVRLTQQAFPFMVLLAAIGLVASLWLWFLRRRRTNAVLAVFVLANMAAVVLAILPFALATTDFRRSNDVRKPPVEEPPPPPSGGPTVVAPARLPALGYLPDDCNVVFGVHAAELEATPAGKKLLHPKAGDAEGRVWLTEQGFAFVEEFAGIQPGQIDHLVVGLKSTTFPPAPMLVVRTRQKYDWAAIARAQGEVKPVEVHGRALYQFKFLEQGYGWLWLADETTLVLVLRATRPDERDKPVLAERPRQGDKLPPRAVRAVLEQRLRQGALLWWVAADLERSFWAGLLLPVGDPKSELANLVKQSKTLVGGLYLPGEARLEGGVEGPDAATATRLAALLQPKLGDPATARVVAPAAGSTEAWVSFQLSGPPETVLRVLQPGKLPLRLGH